MLRRRAAAGGPGWLGRRLRRRAAAALFGAAAAAAAPGLPWRSGARAWAAAPLRAGLAEEPTVADGDGERLLEWLRDEGALVSPSVRVAQVAPLGRELVASEAVDAGEVLIRLLPELCIPAPAGEVDGDGRAMPEDVRLAAALLEVAESDYWSAYRAIWPAREDLEERMPVFWDQARFESLRPRLPGLEAQARSRRRLLRDAADVLGVPLDGLTWAHALVSTRAVGADIDACAMIPGVDIANHDLAPNAELVVAGLPGVATGRATVTKLGAVWPQGTASLVTKEDVAEGEPIRISYGSYPNQRLILDYGFSLGALNPSGEEEKEDASEADESASGWQRED